MDRIFNKNDRFLEVHIDVERFDLFVSYYICEMFLILIICYSQDISYSYSCKIFLRIVAFQRDSHKISISFLKTAFKIYI